MWSILHCITTGKHPWAYKTAWVLIQDKVAYYNEGTGVQNPQHCMRYHIAWYYGMVMQECDHIPQSHYACLFNWYTVHRTSVQSPVELFLNLLGINVYECRMCTFSLMTFTSEHGDVRMDTQKSPSGSCYTYAVTILILEIIYSTCTWPIHIHGWGTREWALIQE